MRNESDKYKLSDILQNNSQDSSETVIIKDRKDWDDSRPKKPEETRQVNEICDPWMECGRWVFKKVLS